MTTSTDRGRITRSGRGGPRTALDSGAMTGPPRTAPPVPSPGRGPGRAVALLMRHAELARFATVGALTFVVDTAVFLALKTTVLEPKPVTAKVVAVVVATIVGYLLNRGWSFGSRGGLARRREVLLYFAVSAVALAVNAAPLGISRYALDLAVPHVAPLTEQVADLVSAQVVGTLLAMGFRWWAFRRWVFPLVMVDGPLGPRP